MMFCAILARKHDAKIGMISFDVVQVLLETWKSKKAKKKKKIIFLSYYYSSK